MHRAHRSRSRSGLLVATIVVGLLAGCAGSDGSDPDPEADGAAARAARQLREYGLTEDEAACMVDRLGAEVVNEAPDLTALTEGGAYQDAAKECLDAG